MKAFSFIWMLFIAGQLSAQEAVVRVSAPIQLNANEVSSLLLYGHETRQMAVFGTNPSMRGTFLTWKVSTINEDLSLSPAREFQIKLPDTTTDRSIKIIGSILQEDYYVAFVQADYFTTMKSIVYRTRLNLNGSFDSVFVPMDTFDIVTYSSILIPAKMNANPSGIKISPDSSKVLLYYFSSKLYSKDPLRMQVKVFDKKLETIYKADIEFPFTSKEFQPNDFTVSNTGDLLFLPAESVQSSVDFIGYVSPKEYAESVRLFKYSKNSLTEVPDFPNDLFKSTLEPRFKVDNQGRLFITASSFDKAPANLNYPKPDIIVALLLSDAAPLIKKTYTIDVEQLKQRLDLEKLEISTLVPAHIISPTPADEVSFLLQARDAAKIVGVKVNGAAVITNAFKFQGVASHVIRVNNFAYVLHTSQIKPVIENHPSLKDENVDASELGGMLTKINLQDGTYSTEWLFRQELVNDHYPYFTRFPDDILKLNDRTILVKGLNHYNLTRVILATITLP